MCKFAHPHKYLRLAKSQELTAPIYILTGSGEEEIEDFCEEYDIDTLFVCTIDPVTLKTIVRANPGVFVVQNGTIIEKYNLRNR